MISFEKCKKVLAAIWLVGFLIPFIILSAQTLHGTFWGGKESEAWALFTPMVLPTIGLIVGVLVADAQNPVVEDRKVNSTIFYVTLVLSLLYLGLVNAIFITMPSLAANATDVTAVATDKDAVKTTSELLDSFKRSGLMLGAIQGLVTLTLGVFFVNKNTKSGAQGDATSSGKGKNKKPADTTEEQAGHDKKPA
jgi:hypothetical protein